MRVTSSRQGDVLRSRELEPKEEAKDRATVLFCSRVGLSGEKVWKQTTSPSSHGKSGRLPACFLVSASVGRVTKRNKRGRARRPLRVLPLLRLDEA